MAKIKHWAEDLLMKVLPIWRGQVEYACEVMEQSIEGLTGKFSVVVKKLELLASDEGCQSREVSSDPGNKAWQDVLNEMKKSANASEYDESLEHIYALEESIHTLVDSYEARLKENQQTSKEIKDQVEEILVDLQFQDRVSQVLKTVIKTQGQLQELLSDKAQQSGQNSVGTEDFDAEKWIENMRNEYAMEDQCLIHDGKVKAESKQVDEITFF